ncbi:MAG: fused MFS/spermidine synthase [Myxococcales bacterium]|nr:fused MFS/spermidine synthase [Myxococcales bacterium]
MPRFPWQIAALLLTSGFCALVYQSAWLRFFRLVFGASTPANAAVIGVFMGGLGIGGLLFGRMADRSRNALRLYGLLELGITAIAVISPWLIDGVRAAYYGMGGETTLGSTVSTFVRLGLAALVLGPPTLLMGGTLPAVVRAVERGHDVGRRYVGLLYALNTLGAVVGVMWASFVAVELLGARVTLWSGAALNLVVVAVALLWSKKPEFSGHEPETGAIPDAQPSVDVVAHAATERRADGAADGNEASKVPAWFVLVAAGLVGFVFLLMELVWYRMLAPILGGSGYTFALILAMALAGIGLGSLRYGMGAQARRPSLRAFATTCALEAVLLMVPFAWGDDFAVFANQLRAMGEVGFGSMLVGWSVIAFIVVLPAALISGYQFPMLIGLFGAGRTAVGRQVGLVYAVNTVGAILGSIAGGFGLMPLLGATAVWRLCGWLLLTLSVLALALAQRQRVSDGEQRVQALGAVLVMALSLPMMLAPGPTAFWRHSPIGIGRFPLEHSGTNTLKQRMQQRRRGVRWQADGVESSVALQALNCWSFLINGKSDGNVYTDASTMVMLGMVGAVLHPEPKTAMVIGLGTGETSGWLAAVPTMTRVDSVELEPAIVEVAKRAAPANHSVLTNPKHHLHIGDAREVLQTTPRRYDLIASEPSNPYRAGVAGLFTAEFYKSVADRLTPNGLLLQWLQVYEVDAGTVRTVLATLRSVFPHVEVWELQRGSDLLLVASLTPVGHDATRLRKRLAEPFYRDAMAKVWGVSGLAGLYSGFIARNELVGAIAQAEGDRRNTDDKTVIEFDAARAMTSGGQARIAELRQLARRLNVHRPKVVGTAPNWQHVDEWLSVRNLAETRSVRPPEAHDAASRARIRARQAWQAGRLRQTVQLWRQQAAAPVAPRDRAMLAEAYAANGEDAALPLIKDVAQLSAAEALLIRATLAAAKGDETAATGLLLRGLKRYQTDPWAHQAVVVRALNLSRQIARRNAQFGQSLFDLLAQPFVMRCLEEERLVRRVELAKSLNFKGLCAKAFAQYEPHPPWNKAVLTGRFTCYRDTNHPLAPQAAADLMAFSAAAPPALDAGL